MNIEKIIARNHSLTEDYLREAKLNTWQKLNFNFRSWLNKHFDIWDIWDIIPYKYERFYHDKVKTIFKPYHSRLRKVIPRQWSDLTELVVDINFEIIKSFYEDEYSKGIVDWESDDSHKNFAQWLEGAYKYITIERPEYEKQMDAAYPRTNQGPGPVACYAPVIPRRRSKSAPYGPAPLARHREGPRHALPPAPESMAKAIAAKF
jgi:hypothetical protein